MRNIGAGQDYLPLGELVYRQIRRAIVRGDYAPGASLSEAHLAKQLGVSKTPVREAVRRLEQEGLVATFPHKGATVTRLSLDDLREIYLMRERLEGLAARLAAERATAPDREEMAQLLADLEESTRQQDMVALRERSVGFHQLIWRIARVTRLRSTLVNLQDYVEMYRFDAFNFARGVEQTTVEHLEVGTAVVNGQPQRAEEQMAYHIRNGWQAVYARELAGGRS